MSTTAVTDYASDNALSSSSTVHARSVEASQPKTSSIRFTSDTRDSIPSAKSSRRVIASSDESTPIKQSDSHVHRNYNTSDATLPLPSPQPLALTGATSQQSGSSESTKVDINHPWYRKLADRYGSITLENKASVARDHLALERTFLAWLRTSLSFASIGIAITQLFRLNSSFAKPSSSQSIQNTERVPFSPFLGHAFPPELLPYLQQSAADLTARKAVPKLGPTLLDQMLLLTSDGDSIVSNVYTSAGLNLDAASRLKHVGKPLGATFIGISIVVLFVGFQRYFEAQHWIIHGKFPASRSSISLVAFAAFALIIASLVIVIVISPNTYES